MARSIGRRKHARKAFIEFNRRGPWTDEERRKYTRQIHHAVNSGGNAINTLPKKKIVSKPKPKPELDPTTIQAGYRYGYYSRRRLGW